MADLEMAVRRRDKVRRRMRKYKEFRDVALDMLIRSQN